MPEEQLLKMDVTIKEAALIKMIRDVHAFSSITVIKVNGEIERVKNDELHTIKDIQKKYGLEKPESEESEQT